MTYELTYTTKPEHIDFQGIMDGLYYPFYLEDCRHKFVGEALNLDLKAYAARGINVVLSQYLIKFIRPLRQDDSFLVTCSAHRDKSGKPQFHLKQEIRKDGKVMVAALFTATCVPSDGGRAFMPDDLLSSIPENDQIDSPQLPAAK